MKILLSYHYRKSWSTCLSYSDLGFKPLNYFRVTCGPSLTSSSITSLSVELLDLYSWLCFVRVIPRSLEHCLGKPIPHFNNKRLVKMISTDDFLLYKHIDPDITWSIALEELSIWCKYITLIIDFYYFDLIRSSFLFLAVLNYFSYIYLLIFYRCIIYE